MIVMTMRYARMSPKYELILEILNYVFTLIFDIECVMKIIVYKLRYFSKRWNIFDFIVVVCTNLSIIARYSLNFQSNVTVI